jgi:ABC-type Zn2+ transport system substrate-binding protein/surface adhesin
VSTPEKNCGGSRVSGGGARWAIPLSIAPRARSARGCGDAADITQILQPNTDAHEHEPRPDDGGPRRAERHRRPLVDLAEKLQVRRPGEPQGDEASRYDPHWWHDPRNVITAVEEIHNALSPADPARAALSPRTPPPTS